MLCELLRCSKSFMKYRLSRYIILNAILDSVLQILRIKYLLPIIVNYKAFQKNRKNVLQETMAHTQIKFSIPIFSDHNSVDIRNSNAFAKQKTLALRVEC